MLWGVIGCVYTLLKYLPAYLQPTNPLINSCRPNSSDYKETGSWRLSNNDTFLTFSLLLGQKYVCIGLIG